MSESAQTTEGVERFGVDRIAAERRRQVQEEGFDRTHDEEHDGGQLSHAAAAYVLATIAPGNPTLYDAEGVPHIWPWAPEWWKPRDPVRNLEKAGALIAAEIDRRLAEGDGGA